MNHATMHDTGHNTVVEFIHFKSNALEQGMEQRYHKSSFGGQVQHASFCFTYHWLICVFLELDQPDPGHVFQVHVPVCAVWGVSVQVG